MSTVLMFVTFFLGFQLLCNRPNKQADDLRKPDEILKDIRANNALALDPKAHTKEGTPVDAKVVADAELYKQRIKDIAEKEGWNENRLKEADLEADILHADTKLKAAIARNEVAPSDEGYMLLHKMERANAGTPLWQKTYKVSDGKGKEVDKSAESLTAELRDDLDARYRTDLVWGFIPGYKLIDTLVGMTGRVPNFSYAFAALVLAILVRAAVWFPMQKQLMWSRQMQQLMPKVNELKEAYAAKDPKGYQTNPEFQQRSMALYKEYGVNPAGGCAPMLIQMPLFLSIYQCMLHYKFAFTKGTFLWINPVSSANSHGFFAPNLGQTDYILIVLYGISMLVSQYLAPISSPENAKQQRMIGIGMSLFISVMMFFWPLPSAFVLYWIFLNTIATFQSLRAYRMPTPPLEKKVGPNGTIIPTETNLADMFGSNGGPSKKKK